MKVKSWIFSVRYWTPEQDKKPHLDRWAVVGPACAATVETALRGAGVPEQICAEIREDAAVRDFVEDKLDADRTGYYVPHPFPAASSWLVCIGPVHEVLDR